MPREKKYRWPGGFFTGDYVKAGDRLGYVFGPIRPDEVPGGCVPVTFTVEKEKGKGMKIEFIPADDLTPHILGMV